MDEYEFTHILYRKFSLFTSKLLRMLFSFKFPEAKLAFEKFGLFHAKGHFCGKEKPAVGIDLQEVIRVKTSNRKRR